MPGRSVRKDPTGVRLAKTLRSAAAGIAYAMGKEIQQRVSVRGDNQQRGWAYSTTTNTYETTRTNAQGEKKSVRRTTRYHVSPKYPARGGIQSDKLKTTHYETSAEFHKAMGAKEGAFNTNKTSGMWSGLTVMPLSPTKARLTFRGRSIGQQPKWSKKKLGRKSRKGPDTRRTQTVAKSRKISNALKAATVWGATRVSLLSPSNREMRLLGNAVQGLIVQALGGTHMGGQPVTAPRIPKSQFINIMMRAQLGGGKIR